MELKRIYNAAFDLYQTELIETIILPYLGDLHLEKNIGLQQEYNN